MARFKVFHKRGGAELVVASGGKVTIESGGTLEAEAGSTITGVDGAATFASDAEAITGTLDNKVICPKSLAAAATAHVAAASTTVAGKVELVIVVGSKNSSNSNRLREVAAIGGIPAYLVDGAEQIDGAWLAGKARIGVTAGASAPEVLVNGVVERLRALGAGSIETLSGVEENVNFPLPKELLAG